MRVPGILGGETCTFTSGMDVINLCTAAGVLQAPVNNIEPNLPDLEEDLNSSVEFDFVTDYDSCPLEDLCPLPYSKSGESSNIQQNYSWDQTMEQSVHNPLPLHCLAAKQVPESLQNGLNEDPIFLNNSEVLENSGQDLKHLKVSDVEGVNEEEELSGGRVPPMDESTAGQNGVERKDDGNSEVEDEREEGAQADIYKVKYISRK